MRGQLASYGVLKLSIGVIRCVVGLAKPSMVLRLNSSLHDPRQ